MNDSVLFYGFRGFITFPDQLSLFNLSIENSSNGKNQVFREFFSMVQETGIFNSVYQSRNYILLFKNIYGDVVHCQLARKKKFNKRELIEKNIVVQEDNDYPFVNLFVDLKSQKFLVESKTQVFENYATCGSVLENIINNNFKQKDIRITLNQITDEENFWQHFEKDSKVYNIELNLVSPNIFGAENAADALMKDAQDNFGSEKLDIKFCNSEGNLKPNKVGMNSFIRYICAGGGFWKLTKLGENGKKENVSSKIKSTKVKIPILIEKLNNNDNNKLNEADVNNIIYALNSIEIFDNLKENRK